MADCELLKRTRAVAEKKGLPVSEVVCEFLKQGVCDGPVCWKMAETKAQPDPYASSPTPIERFVQRMEVTITGRRLLSPVR